METPIPSSSVSYWQKEHIKYHALEFLSLAVILVAVMANSVCIIKQICNYLKPSPVTITVRKII